MANGNGKNGGKIVCGETYFSCCGLVETTTGPKKNEKHECKKYERTGQNRVARLLLCRCTWSVATTRNFLFSSAAKKKGVISWVACNIQCIQMAFKLPENGAASYTQTHTHTQMKFICVAKKDDRTNGTGAKERGLNFHRVKQPAKATKLSTHRTQLFPNLY